LAIGFDSLVVGVRAGAEVGTFPSACFYGTTLYDKVKSGSTKKGTRQAGHWQRSGDGYPLVKGIARYCR
jgi:hypothetical protein